MKSCGMSTIKYLLFVFNLIFALSGLGILVAGAIVLADIGEFSHFMEGKIITTPIILMVAGVIVFIIAFLGCYGAIKEQYPLLMAFAVILAVIFIVEMAVGITAAVYKGDFSTVMKGALKKSMKNYTTIEADRTAWDNVQTKLSCCGVEKSDDWIEAAVLNPGLLPLSCCNYPTSSQNSQCPQYDRNVYDRGCFMILEEKVKNNANVIMGVGIGIALIEIAGIALACSLAMAIKNDGDK